MPDSKPQENLTLTLDGLEIQVLGRQFPQARDYYDGNWLNIDCRMDTGHSRVQVHGPLLLLQHIDGFGRDCRIMHSTLKGLARLDSNEPGFSLELRMGDRGGVRAEILLSPNQSAEEHRYRLELDQSYLPDLIAQCQAVIDHYGVRGQGNV